MTTLLPADTCAPPVTISREEQLERIVIYWQERYERERTLSAVSQPTLHDHLLTMLLRKAIPYLEHIEHGTRTSADLRNLIKQAKAATGA